MPDPFNIPTPPDPARVAMIVSSVLSLAKLLAGAGVVGAAWASYSPDEVSAVVTFLMFGASLVAGLGGWIGSLIQHRKEAQESRDLQVAAAATSATLSANAGVPIPVTVVVTPPGQDNVAVKVSATEVSKAPSVPADVQPSPAPRIP